MDAGLPGGLEWHTPLVLATPALLALAALAAVLLRPAAWLAWLGLAPAFLLQGLLAIAAAPVAAGPAARWACTGAVSAWTSLLLGLLLAGWLRPLRADTGAWAMAPWRTCLAALCGLALPLSPLPLLVALLATAAPAADLGWKHPRAAGLLWLLALPASALWCLGSTAGAPAVLALGALLPALARPAPWMLAPLAAGVGYAMTFSGM